MDDFPGCLFLSLVTPNVVVAFLGAFGGLWLFNRRLEAFLLLSTGVALVDNAGLERIVRRPSPDPDLISVAQEPGPFTFPSGHAAGVVVLYGLIFYFATVFVRQPALRLLIQAACVYVSVFTIIERLYVGVHWFSDMYGGVLHGALWLVLIIFVYRQRPRARVPAPSSPVLGERLRASRAD